MQDAFCRQASFHDSRNELSTHRSTSRLRVSVEQITRLGKAALGGKPIRAIGIKSQPTQQQLDEHEIQHTPVAASAGDATIAGLLSDCSKNGKSGKSKTMGAGVSANIHMPREESSAHMGLRATDAVLTCPK